MTRLRIVTLRVKEQAEALKFSTERLGFQKRTDIPYGEGSRWLTVVPQDDSFVEIVLQPADWFKGGRKVETPGARWEERDAGVRR